MTFSGKLVSNVKEKDSQDERKSNQEKSLVRKHVISQI